MYIPGLSEVLVINPGLHPRPQRTGICCHHTGCLLPAFLPAIALTASGKPRVFFSIWDIMRSHFSLSEIRPEITLCAEHCSSRLGPDSRECLQLLSYCAMTNCSLFMISQTVRLPFFPIHFPTWTTLEALISSQAQAIPSSLLASCSYFYLFLL